MNDKVHKVLDHGEVMTGAIAELNPKSEDMGGFIQYFDIDGIQR
jgi:hypothetical protein